ncbi:hypothetical protein JCM39068_01200 [Desulfocastanea catecholica]
MTSSKNTAVMEGASSAHGFHLSDFMGVCLDVVFALEKTFRNNFTGGDAQLGEYLSVLFHRRQQLG